MTNPPSVAGSYFEQPIECMHYIAYCREWQAYVHLENCEWAKGRGVYAEVMEKQMVLFDAARKATGTGS